MRNVLPPQAGLTVGGIIYRYRVEKEQVDDFSVTVSNDDRLNGGKIFSYTDDWSGKNGTTLLKQYPLGDVVIERFGDGSITSEGKGEVKDADVRYSYTYDECYDPLSDPECPGYAEAYYQWLLAQGLISAEEEYEDPLEDEQVQKVLEQQVELEKETLEEGEEVLEEEEEEKKELQKLLSIAEGNTAVADRLAQQAMLEALARVKILNPYIEFGKTIKGGEYVEQVELKDKKIDDNGRAARRMGLAQDKVHEEIVASQYD